MSVKNLRATSNEKGPLVNKILFLETNSEYYSYFRNMYLTLEKFCRKIIHFNRRDYYFKYGKKKMNQMLISLIKKEKPDYIFTWLTWDEFYPETLLKIKEISPNTKTVAIFGDDIHQFEDFSRYYALLFDYSFTTLKSFLPKYEKDGIKQVFLTSLTDTKSFMPMEVEKKYDVTFIGSQKEDKSGRYELIKYMKDKGIKIKVFGFGWDNYPEFRDIYGGVLNDKEMVRVINESKINLCFSKNNFGNEQMKAKVFEVNSCKSFLLCEYAGDYLDYFTEEKDIIMFKNKKEMLNKITYYLKNKKEREKIALAAYGKTIKEYSLHKELYSFFKKTLNKKSHKDLPSIKDKIFEIDENKINTSLEKIKTDLADFDYVCFKNSIGEFLPYKNYFQVYSLEKSKKDISCCNYYINSKGLGDYMLFFARDAFGFLERESALSLLNINQLVVTKNYFLKNFIKFRKVFKGHKIDFITKENTAFVAMPLVRIKIFNINDYNLIKKTFDPKFKYKLYSLIYEKKIFNSLYPYRLFIEVLKGKTFIFKILLDVIKDKNIWVKIKKFN